VTTKRLLITVFSILGALFLLVAIFAGAVIGLAFYTIGHSEAAATAKKFLRQSEKLKEDVGEVRDFGSFVTGSINGENSAGAATLHLKVIGERRTVKAMVEMVYAQSGQWRVTNASYVNEAGQTVYLLDKYSDGSP
jgi:hypothetical protein